MVSKRISEKLAEEYSKMQEKTLCTSCEWVGKTGDPDSWRCNRPGLIETNYVTGIVEIRKMLCRNWNDEGDCTFYEKHVLPPVENETLPEITKKSEKDRTWKRILRAIKSFFLKSG